MKRAKQLIISLLLCWALIFILFFEIEFSPDKTRWALANKGIGSYRVTVNDCPTFASGSRFKKMGFSYDNKYLMVQGKHSGKNTFAVFNIEKESIHNINEDIQKACLSKDSQLLDYQAGEKLSLDFIGWHQDYNYIKFDYEIIHSDGSRTTGFFWLDYEGCKLMAVNEEIK